MKENKDVSRFFNYPSVLFFLFLPSSCDWNAIEMRALLDEKKTTENI